MKQSKKAVFGSLKKYNKKLNKRVNRLGETHVYVLQVNFRVELRATKHE
jgi:hypothetical protein